MPLPGFGDNLRDWFHTPFCCRFQPPFNASTDFYNLFRSQIVRVIH